MADRHGLFHTHRAREYDDEYLTRREFNAAMEAHEQKSDLRWKALEDGVADLQEGQKKILAKFEDNGHDGISTRLTKLEVHQALVKRIVYTAAGIILVAFLNEALDLTQAQTGIIGA